MFLLDSIQAFPDAPLFFSHWGLWLAAGLVLLGSETAGVLAAFLAGIGILSLEWTFFAVWISALLADVFWFCFALAFPDAGILQWWRSPSFIEMHRTRLPKKHSARLLYRFFPGPMPAFPVQEAMSSGLERKATPVILLAGSFLWAAVVFMIGLGLSWAASAWTHSLVSIWRRLPGFLLLLAVLFPMLRYILWFEFEKWQLSTKRSATDENSASRR